MADTKKILFAEELQYFTSKILNLLKEEADRTKEEISDSFEWGDLGEEEDINV